MEMVGDRSRGFGTGTMKHESEDFCSICGHMIPSRSHLGGAIEGELVNYERRETATILLHLCTECVTKLDEIESGGVDAARRRAKA